MFDSLPNTFVSYIFEFLNLQDFPTISRTCPRFFRIINEHKKFWTRECLTHYLSFELEAYSELYDFQDYKRHIQLKALSSQKFSYKQHLIDGFGYKRDFADVLSNFGSQDQVQAFLMSFFETLKQPLLPLANLKRETILCTTQTIYQNKLSEVLYEDSGMVVKKLSFPSESEEFINGIKNLEEEILKEFMTCNRDSLAKARWYTFECKNSKSGEFSPIDEELDVLGDLPGFGRSQSFGLPEMQSINTKPSWLLDFYNCLCHTLIHFCGIISLHLNSIDNTYDLLAEYTLRWNTYVSTMIELEQTFKAFTEIMNKTYEHAFEGHPCFPKFSIWRLMTKIWLREVYEQSNLNFSLNEAFLRILSNHREKNVQKALNVNFGGLSSQENGDELPKFLYVSLKTKDKKKSTLQYQNAQQLQNFRPSCLDQFEEAEKQILSAFLQSVLDISLTEVNIHYLDCTEMNVNYPYRETEEAFLLKSNEFYNEYQPLFAESPDYFYQFLKSDCALISDILPQRTFIKLETVQIQNGFQSNKEFVRNQLNKLDKEQLEKCEKETVITNDQANEIIDFIHNVITEVLEEPISMPEESKCNAFYSLPPIDFEVEDEESPGFCEEKQEKQEPFWSGYPDKKGLARKLTKLFETHYMNFKGNFEYLHQRLQEFEQIKEKDKYIKEMNTEKNIPFEMGDVDKLFYDLDKNIELSLLQKLSEDYNNFCNEGNKNGSNGLDLPPLEEVEEQGPNGNQFGELGFDPNTLDFDNLDMFNLENPSLRRAPI